MRGTVKNNQVKQEYKYKGYVKISKNELDQEKNFGKLFR